MSPKVTILFVLFIFVNQVWSASDKVICYYASWGAERPGNGKFLPEDIDPNICTHINYAFLGLSDNGTLEILDEDLDVTQGGFSRISALKEQNPNLKVLFSVGGAAAIPWTFVLVSNDSDNVARMVQSALDLCEKYNFDGLDVDWEYPYGESAQQFVNLIASLKAAFEPRGYLVTAAVNSIPTEVGGGYDIPGLSAVLDIINVMTYDFHNYIGGVTAENSPLYGGVNESQWEKDNRNVDGAIRQWIDGGADPAKVAVGIAFYGHHFILANPSNHGLDAVISGPGEPGPYTDNLSSLGYNEICEFHPNGNTVFLDDMKVPYMYEDTFWIGYDNEESVAAKVQYAKDNNLAGVFIWSVETDDLYGFCGQRNGLLNSIKRAMES
ncbi:acidic mammalian chitinase-like [Zophobas morio]|uniref:acidic mammalian chitinase-like n=1 Tax=Zophobas morio TaxID=2755281 RepID=UPI00308379B8